MEHRNNGNGSSPGGELIEAGVATATAEPTSADDLARLVGLQESPSPGGSPVEVSTESSSSEPSDLLDEDDLEPDDDGGKADKSGKTKTPLWANPFIKVLFVAGLAGSAFLMVALVFGAMQRTAGGGGAVDIVVSDEDVEPEVDPIEAALQLQEEQIGELKTQNALGAQQQSLAIQADQELNPAEVLALRNRQLDLVETIQEGQAAQPATDATATPPMPRPTPVAPPRSVPTSRPAPTPRPVPTPRSAPVPALPPPPPLSPATASRPVDPQEQWNTLLALGSYGQGSAGATVPSVTEAATPAVTATTVPEVASPQAIPQFSETAPLPSAESAVPVLTEAPTAGDLTYAQEEAALLGHTLKTVPSGTLAAAQLVSPIYWAQDLANEQQPQRTALELTEPLYADDGSVALAPGTLLVAEVTVIAGSGLLDLVVTDVVTVDDGGVQRTMSLPNRNFVIAGQDGNPLIASVIQDEGGIRAAELQLGILGALGTVGELLNRPDSSTTVVGGDTSISTVENGSVNILAGLLQGATDAVLPIEQTRILDRIEDIQDRPGIWFHPADAEVLVFVADEFTFQLD